LFFLPVGIVIPVTHKLKGYIIFVGKYIYKVYIFLITSRVDLDRSVFPL